MENLYKKANLLFLLSDMQVVYNSCISKILIAKNHSILLTLRESR